MLPEHECLKEEDIKELKSDVKVLTEIHHETDRKVDRILILLEGNGSKGAMEKISDLETYKRQKELSDAEKKGENKVLCAIKNTVGGITGALVVVAFQSLGGIINYFSGK